MISLLFISLAAICNSIMDICSHHYDKSVFSLIKNKKQYWDATFSWKNKYVDYDNGDRRRRGLIFNIFKKQIFIPKPVSLTDAWHLFKRLMIIFLVLSIVFYSPITFGLKNILSFIFLDTIVVSYTFSLVFDFILYLIIWNMFFHFFYHKFLRINKIQ